MSRRPGARPALKRTLPTATSRTRARERLSMARQQFTRARVPERGQVSLARQVRSLIASKKKDAADVDRSQTITNTTVSCLTSSTNFAVAATGSGLLDCDADSVLINNVRIKGLLSNPATLDLDPLSNLDVCVRKLVVWYYKPLAVASAAGTLPAITECLSLDTIGSLYTPANQNAGRFVILSDRKWNLGSNTHQAVTAVGHARVSGRNMQYYDYLVPVNKVTKFSTPSVSGTAGGHYDSDSNVGRVTQGLLVLYTQTSITGLAADAGGTRLNYTG